MLYLENITKDRIPWLIQLLYDFPYAMDLVDKDGSPDHDKMLPAFAAIAFVVFIFMHPTPSWEAMVAWIVAGGYIYGFSAWRLVAEKAAERLTLHGKQAQPAKNRQTSSESASQDDRSDRGSAEAGAGAVGDPRLENMG